MKFIPEKAAIDPETYMTVVVGINIYDAVCFSCAIILKDKYNVKIEQFASSATKYTVQTTMRIVQQCDVPSIMQSVGMFYGDLSD